MPGTLEAALVFAYAVVPGYLGLTGYQAGRARRRAVPDRDLHVIAEAFVLSLFWIVLPPIGLAAIDLAQWVGASPIDDSIVRILASTALVVVVFLLPLPAGYGVGRFVQAARKGEGGSLGKRLDEWIPQQQSAWDTIWAPVLMEENGRALVRVEFDDDRAGVTGQFADDSQVDLSPDPPQLFLESTIFTVDVGGAPEVVLGPGMHVDGSKIRYITVEPLS